MDKISGFLTKKWFRWNFLHPNWFNTELSLQRISVTQRQRLNSFLTTFLELGRVIKLRDKLSRWVRKMDVKRGHVQTFDVTKINSWQNFIATIMLIADDTCE